MTKALKIATFVWVIYPFLSFICFLSEILFLFLILPFYAYVEMPEIEVKNNHSYITKPTVVFASPLVFEYKEYRCFIFEKHYSGAREYSNFDSVGLKDIQQYKKIRMNDEDYLILDYNKKVKIDTCKISPLWGGS